ncbi:hypothetical protein DPX16_22982 [Anabarilius grahami]|uniref:Uncharacterized protein n=1 Tax=Anabarilius grahami TaxID=495550 RepID=A0A3N0XHA2_ANAGA|nr:hypothetical protein DPX16_22982 [Anabarilius grahami]
MAKRAVFAFYVLAVLRAWRVHLGSLDHGPVSQPEPAAVPEQPEPSAIPEQPEPATVPEQSTILISPAMARRTVFTFYVLAVLRARRMHASYFDSGPVCQPEPAVIPEQPAAVPELSALPDTATEAPWSALPPPPRPSVLLKPTWSVSPAPPCGTQPGLRPCWGPHGLRSGALDLARHPSPWSSSSPPPSDICKSTHSLKVSCEPRHYMRIWLWVASSVEKCLDERESFKIPAKVQL